MKKLIAILMALAVCGTVAYTAYATEGNIEIDEATTTTEAEENAVLDMAAELANDKKANEIAQNIAKALANGQTKEDVKGLVNSLGKYINGKGFTIDDIKNDAGAANDVLNKFLEDCGVNTEVLKEAVAESSIANAVLGVYYKPEEPTTTTAAPDEPTTEPYSNPDCGAEF